MTEFEKGLANDMLDHLMKVEWWRDLLTYRDGKTPLFVAVRDNRLSIYVCRRVIFKRIREERGAIRVTFDGRYFYGPKAKRATSSSMARMF
jgi:hypothetical protein